MVAPDLLAGRRVLVTGGGTGGGTGLGRAVGGRIAVDGGKRFVPAAAQNDAVTLLGWTGAQWDAARPAPAPRTAKEPA